MTRATPISEQIPAIAAIVIARSEKLLLIFPIFSLIDVSIGMKKDTGITTIIVMTLGHVMCLALIAGSVVSDCLSGFCALNAVPISYNR